MGIAVIVEAILSFVGLSVEPDVPAWGVMIADARQYMYQAEWGLILPVLGIFVSVLGANLLGDGLRRGLDRVSSGGSPGDAARGQRADARRRHPRPPPFRCCATSASRWRRDGCSGWSANRAPARR